MHTTYGMGGVFSYLVYGSRGNLNSRYLEWGFLAMFSINLSFLYIPYVVVCIKKALPIPQHWNRQGSKWYLCTPILARFDFLLKCILRKLNFQFDF